MDKTKKLTMKEMISYGIGDITANLYLQFLSLIHICITNLAIRRQRWRPWAAAPA